MSVTLNRLSKTHLTMESVTKHDMALSKRSAGKVKRAVYLFRGDTKTTSLAITVLDAFSIFTRTQLKIQH